VIGRGTFLLLRLVLVGFPLICARAFGQPLLGSAAAMISDFRLKHGEGRVTLDATLTRIAHEQAAAMAAKGMAITARIASAPCSMNFSIGPSFS